MIGRHKRKPMATSHAEAERRVLMRKLRGLQGKPHRYAEARALAARLDQVERETMTAAEAATLRLGDSRR